MKVLALIMPMSMQYIYCIDMLKHLD